MPSKQDVILSALANTIEHLAFTEIVPAPEPRGDLLDDNAMWGSVDVRMPFSGSVIVIMPGAMVTEFTDTIWCGEEEDIEATKRDFIKEIANTVAGRMVAASVSRELTFALTLPKTGDGLPEHFNEDEHVEWFITDSGSAMAVQLSGNWPDPREDAEP